MNLTNAIASRFSINKKNKKIYALTFLEYKQ